MIDSIGNDSRVGIFESFDDPGQPYTCNQWGDLGKEGIPLIVESDNLLYNLFSVEGYRGVAVVLDPNMVFRYIGAGTDGVLNVVEQILLESHWALGDIDSNQIINIQDIVLLVNFIIDSSYNFSADLNEDGIINIQDIIIIINIILN